MRPNNTINSQYIDIFRYKATRHRFSPSTSQWVSVTLSSIWSQLTLFQHLLALVLTMSWTFLSAHGHAYPLMNCVMNFRIYLDNEQPIYAMIGKALLINIYLSRQSHPTQLILQADISEAELSLRQRIGKLDDGYVTPRYTLWCTIDTYFLIDWQEDILWGSLLATPEKTAHAYRSIEMRTNRYIFIPMDDKTKCLSTKPISLSRLT